jgi:transposase InsO family protein
VLKWRHAGRLEDGKSGPIKPESALSDLEQQIICEFRRTTKLSLDDCYISLKEKIPALSRSNLYRCFKRHQLNILPKEEGEKKEKQSFKEYPPGFVHVDITEVRVGKQKLYLFVGIDRCSKYVYVELHERMRAEESVAFLKGLVADCPFNITKILTDNGAQFTYSLLQEPLKPTDKIHPFDALCAAEKIEHRLTQFRHPWTNGQVEITNKMLKNHTTKTYHYDSPQQLKAHLMTFLLYYNHQKKLKSLKFISPYDKLIQIYQQQPELFKINPYHKIMGLNNKSYTSFYCRISKKFLGNRNGFSITAQDMFTILLFSPLISRHVIP